MMNEDISGLLMGLIGFAVIGVFGYFYGVEKDKQARAEAERKLYERQRKEIERNQKRIQKQDERDRNAAAKAEAKAQMLVEKEANRIANLSLPENVTIERIETRLFDFKQLIGKVEVKGTVTGAIFEETGQREIFYDIDLAEQSCTCRNFKKKKAFAKNDIRRFCDHLMNEFGKRDLFEYTHHRTLMVGELGARGATQSAYALKHFDLPLMYILVEKENPWLNVYCRTKQTGENIYNASGYYDRHGYNIIEKRWSYGEGATGISLLRDFFKSVTTLEDIELLASQPADNANSRPLSEQADPRLNPNQNSDQFGPETDAWEIPESNMVSENPCECSLLFSYTDSRGAKSRRTVDFKKHQFYGSEGSYLYGECRMRKAGRTFNTKKMTDVIDANTGELIENVRDYAQKFWADSTKAKLKVWANENERIAKAFLYLLRGSKRGAEAEYKVLAAIYSDMLGGDKVTMSDIQWLYKDASPTTAVGFQRFVGGIIKNHPDKLNWFKENAIKLALARARPNFSDKAAVDYLNERIS